jgi:hypothetical protein
MEVSGKFQAFVAVLSGKYPSVEGGYAQDPVWSVWEKKKNCF